ncbi:MAG TPA: alkaline phosphatase family protein [Bryobacteraceae bacterium]
MVQRTRKPTLAIRFLLLFLVPALLAQAEVKRIVIIKIDGLPGWYLDEVLSKRDPATGNSLAPWFDHIFVQHGVRVKNFYTRGISLSVPSWSLLDTGQHLQIHGNVEYDRYTLKVYDYMNFFSFYVDYSRGNVADMPGVEVLDDAGVKLFADYYPLTAAYRNSQLFSRGAHLKMLQTSLTNTFQPSRARLLFDQWQAGFSMSANIYDEMERAVMDRLADPKFQYLDYFTGEFDHQAHLTMDQFTLQQSFSHVDRSVGRLWSAIQQSPLADETVFVAVSDHGMNTTEGVYSQAYDLVRLFSSAAGGGHHVVTNRILMQEFKLRGLDPFVFKVTTPSADSFYLKGQSAQYPTVLLDLDGNERACVYLRNNQLNQIQMLLQAINSDKPRAKQYADQAIEIINSQRPRWEKALRELRTEIGVLETKRDSTPKDKILAMSKYSKEQLEQGVLIGQMRNNARLDYWTNQARRYSNYSRTLEHLLAMKRDDLAQGHFKIQELIAPEAMGEQNTLEDLENYSVALTSDGFRTINYLRLLTSQSVKNTPQPEVGAKPIDFVAVNLPDEHAILMYASPDHIVKVHRREDGQLRYEALTGWKEGLPLRLLEDPALELPEGQTDREAWLSSWHTEREWFRAVHRTRYSNGIIGITEQFSPVASKERQLVQSDLLVMANDHWNFNVRSFNPGGNHGSFLRISTHSVLCFWGGAKTGLASGVAIDEPYDSLSLVPTLMRLTGKKEWKGPGEPIEGLMRAEPVTTKPD